jgi:hypothetical protein
MIREGGVGYTSPRFCVSAHSKGLENGLDVNAVDKGLMARRSRLKTGKTRSMFVKTAFRVLITAGGLESKDTKPLAAITARQVLKTSVEMMPDAV